MDIVHCVKESELVRHVNRFEFPLESAKQEWKRQLLTNFTTDTTLLQKRAESVRILSSLPHLVTQSYTDLLALQEDERFLLEFKSSETSKTAEEQIFFTGDHTKPLNCIPYVLTLLVFFKIWLAPLFALMSPLILFFMPYVIMHTMFDMKIPWDMYITMMKQMMFGISSDTTWSLKQYAQVGWTCLSLGQGIIMPFVTAYHTYNLDTAIVKRGRAIQRIAQTAARIQTQFQAANPAIVQSIHLQVPEPPSDPREAVAWADQEKLALPTLWKLTGQLAVLTTMARDTRWIQYSPTSESSSFELQDFSDLAISAKVAISSHLSLNKHSLLTGPNRGGKSSSLRAILQQVLLAQTFGLTYGSKGSWKPFQQIFTRLKSKDHSGKESLFEMEVRMAATMLKCTEQSNTHTLLLIDELFHSTNPPDAETSAKVFLSRLWKCPNAKSIISTHIFSLCEAPGHEGIQTLCVPAKESDDMILYSYQLQPGICRVSSVREVLREAGLLLR